MNYNQLIDYFAQVIQEIFNRVGNAKDLTNDKNAQELIKAILSALDSLGLKTSEVMPKELEKAYLQAVSDSTKDLVAQNVKVDALTPAEVVRKKLHVAALKILVRDTLEDLRTAIRTARNSAVTTIKRVLSKTKKEITKGLIKGNSRKFVSKKVAKAFQEEGLVCFVTSDNKRIRLDKYAKIVTSVKMRDASTQGAVNRYKESGVDLVRISSQKPTCHVCSRYSDMVISLTGKHKGFKSINDVGVRLPPYHPHCRCTCSSYVIEYKTDAEIKEEQEKWNSFSLSVDNRSPAEKRAYDKEQEIRRKAHEELKLYEKYSAVLGDSMYKTIGAFRRAKRSNAKSWQEMQVKYRQMNKELKALE
ncbi:phage minor capsid protein [Bacillus weihaiensis]|uniref:phage minor capsid protein n=1 Tax=Bacillus weihaiensis TaxID=1547283 RepID=UPI0023556904|nr:phage minor capsid protein [Bacillus weihaiensis]